VVIRLVFWFLVVVPVHSIAAGVSNKDLTDCAVIQNDGSRLQCFDWLVDTRLGFSSPYVGSGKWMASRSVNPLDDTNIVYLRIKSDQGIDKRGRPISLGLRCKSNKTEMFISWNDYLGGDVWITSRVGAAKAKRERWSVSTDKTAAFKLRPIPTIKRLIKADQYVAEVVPYNDNPLTAIFDVRGLSEAIKPLRKECGW
tara:strand:- start:30493 stop:31086 length:594 start_codon:yes stop_codon:yes gene_type:complete